MYTLHNIKPQQIYIPTVLIVQLTIPTVLIVQLTVTSSQFHSLATWESGQGVGMIVYQSWSIKPQQNNQTCFIPTVIIQLT